ncbi:hypothetical protein QBC35DRAFT_77611 [Podospora australis]|uniref:Oxidoreductase n=1 Tax=Podospora australis TaxID=1536484 RepID=A0AAN6WKW5_9PEZI|nr:hypothetical protein QBC35DRAFT_77611 [Podospora australis]
MARFFITGSSDGLGLLTAKKLLSLGHEVVLHARNASRADHTRQACPGAVDVLIGDLSSIDETKSLAAQAAAHGPYEAVLHNAGVYSGMEFVPGKSGLPTLFTVNTLAPYILTVLMKDSAKRLVYVSSELHHGGKPRLNDVENSSYGDSKVQVIMLGKAFARLFRGGKEAGGDGDEKRKGGGDIVGACSVHPGWVPTKMGGANATDDLGEAVEAFVQTSLGTLPGSNSGKYFGPGGVEEQPERVTEDVKLQDSLLERLAEISGVRL